MPLPLLLFAAMATGAALFRVAVALKQKSYRQLAEEIISKAEIDAERIAEKGELALKERNLDEERSRNERWQKEKEKLERLEEKISRREEKLEEKLSLFSKKFTGLENREQALTQREIKIADRESRLKDLEEQLTKKLEQLAFCTASEAKQLLLENLVSEVKQEAAAFIEKSGKEAAETAEVKAKHLIATAIQRLAVPTATTSTVKTIPLPGDEIKGRIIGREGRNIRAFEKASGVTVVIDDTPRAAVISGFDPVRLHIAYKALASLIEDGRVHPTSIEEAVEEAKAAVEQEIIAYGRDAALRAEAIDLHPELIKFLGRLKFRHSYNQNILEHSLEVSHLMGIMAAELGLNSRMAKRIGLLHDIGKAATHEMEGSHALIGHRLALKYGETAEVANGIGCHHKEMEATTIEGSLCASADAISASRPGARSDTVDEYIRRQKELEKIAYGFPGVQKAFALQAGREMRVFVFPDMIDDRGLANLARDLSKKIESQIHGIGQVKISVTREKQVIEYI